jgi:ribosomal-protein-serine acetyltransferase
MKSNLFEIKIDDSLALIIPLLENASEIFNLIDDDREHLGTWLPWVDSTNTVEDVRINLTSRIESFDKKEQASFYGTLDGEFVASVGFVSLNQNEGEIGYWLLSKYRGRGLMTTFVKACIDFGFEKLQLDRIIIKCAEGNVKSAGIPIRLGFIQSAVIETTRIRNGGEHHTLIFTLERNSWKK